MGWLRKERDLIGLVVVWTVLLQSIVLPFTSGLHAATLLSGSESNVICSSRASTVTPQKPGQQREKPDCQCCHMSCRQGCGGALGGILPDMARVPLPSSTVIALASPRIDSPTPNAAKYHASQPRAPPLA